MYRDGGWQRLRMTHDQGSSNKREVSFIRDGEPLNDVDIFQVRNAYHWLQCTLGYLIRIDSFLLDELRVASLESSSPIQGILTTQEATYR